MKKLLFVDTETGGLDSKEHSLLSIGFVVWENGEIVDSKEWFILGQKICFTPSSLKINNMNFNDFILKAIEPQIVMKELIDFCNKNFDDNPITLAGHNINFDVSFLKQFFQEQNSDFSKRFSHRTIDTSAILKFLYLKGTFNEDISSSDKAFNYFGIRSLSRHTALGDALCTAQLFNCLLKL